jgi:putative transposase
MNICRNVVVKVVSDDNTPKYERVIWLDRRRDLIAVYDLDDVYQFPQILKYTDYMCQLSELKEKEIVEHTTERECVRTSSLNEKQIAARDKAWSIICEIVESEPDVFFSCTRTPMIKAAMEKHKVNRNYVVRKMMLFWKHGMSINALAYADYAKGGRGKPREFSENKRGRPFKTAGINNVGKNITGIDVDNINAAVEKYYLVRTAPTMRKAYRCMLRDSYGIRFKEEIPDRGADPVIPMGMVPSYNSFRYWLKKLVDPVEAIIRRHGKLEKKQNHSAVIGNQTSMAEGPGAIYQIDATIADLYVLDDTRSLPIGRPVLYMVVDTWTHCVAGMHVGLKGPSWDGAMMALYNCTLDKVEYCKSLDIPIYEADWPVKGLCRTIQADRGEFASSKPAVLKDTLGIEVRLCAAGMAKWKGIVESKFRQINNTAIESIKEGKVQKHRKPRLEENLKESALYTLREFEQIIIACILEYNNTLLRDYPIQDWMRKYKVKPVPQALWLKGLQHVGGFAGISIPKDKLMVSLMHHKEATIGKNGLAFNKLRYVNSDDMDTGYYDKTRIKPENVRVSYDPRDMRKVYVILDGIIKEYELVERPENAVVEEVVQMQKEEDNEAIRNNEERKNRIAVATETIIGDIQRQAKKDALKNGNSGKKKSINIRENRRQAQRELDQKNSFVLTSTQSRTDTHVEGPSEYGMPVYEDEQDIM